MTKHLLNVPQVKTKKPYVNDIEINNEGKISDNYNICIV